MTSPMENGSEAVLEDGQLIQEQGYTNEGSAKEEDASANPENDEYWLKRARSSFSSSSDWYEVAVRRRMEDNMRLFNSDHPRGSRYNEEAYQKRSRLFRPKTRSGVRKIEAATAAAFFATQDALTCTPPNSRDPMQRMGAESMAELLNYRLQNDIPWFLTCVGAIQDAAKQGVVISKQVWNWKEVTDAYEEEMQDVMTGRSMGTRTTFERRVIKDHPDIILIPVENIRFSPAADWRNPVQTSPFLIEMEPWYVGDIVEKANEGPQGPYDVGFRKLDRGTIRSAMKQNYDPVRQAREGHREDRYEEGHTDIEDHDVVWVHHNYTRIDGQDWYYATLGTEIMLTDPVPIEETTPLRERPYVCGQCVVETHKPYPAGLVELGRPIQEEVNDITNLRIDNIRHIISPRYFIKRGTSVDVRSLLRNIAGGVTAMEDPQNDVNIRQIQDTTSSSFQEHDRLSVEFDELVGTSSQSSIAANQNITERVGNTQMLKEDANQLTELTIRTFSETWVEPVLQQVMELERALESDAVVMTIVGQRMNMPAEAVFRMMEVPVRVTVNVGFGATNPQRRLQKVAMAFQTLAQINPEWVMKADQMEVVQEVLGAVGYKSAERFFPELAQSKQGEQQNPEMQRLQQENEQLKQMIQGEGQKYETQLKGKQMDVQARVQMKQMELEHRDRQQMSADQLKLKLEQNNWQKALLDHQIKKEQNEFKRQELVQQRIALNHTIAMDERQYELAQQAQEMAVGQDMQPSEPKDKIDPTSGKPMGGSGGGPTNVKNPSPPNPREAKAKEPKAPQQGQRIASTPKLGNTDEAGVIARGNYGAIPFKEG